MSVFLGTTGNIRLRRRSGLTAGSFSDEIKPDDINTTLARVGCDKSLDNLITGDRIEISTEDARGLMCFAPDNWSSGAVEQTISGYINVNALGGIRLFPSFEAAVNNNRSLEYTVTSFSGDPLPVVIGVRDTTYDVLGNVTSYELNTARESVETTSLSDKFKNQYTAGLISGSGRIDCMFDYKSTGIVEPPMLLMQTIQRIDIGSSIDLALYLINSSLDQEEQSVFYEFSAVITNAGISVDTNNVVQCSIDFLTTGEIRLLVGEPVGYVLKEDDDRIQLQQSLDFLLKETED